MTDKYIVRCVPITTIKVCGKIYEADVETSLVISQKGFNELLGYIKVISKEPFVDNNGLVQPEIAEDEDNVLEKAKTRQLESISYEDILNSTKSKNKTSIETSATKKRVAPKKD